MNFSARSCKKCLISWKSTRNHWFGQNYATFSNKLPCLCISINFSGKSCKKCLISWNSTKNHWFGQSFATFGTSYNVFFLLTNFQEKSCKKCVVSWKSTKNHPFGQIFATFRTNYHVFAFRWTFPEKVAKSPSFREKARKIVDLAKTRNISNKLPCFGVSMNFWAKGCKKLLNSWKSTKNHRFGQNFLTFRTNYHVFAFRWTFPENVAKSASFREKARKIVDLAKTRNCSNKLPCFDALVNFSAKSCRKCLVFWENSKNHRFGQNLQLFRTKDHVYAFRWTFQQKVAKKASFREKARKIINFAKSLQLFEQTSRFLHFDEFSRKKFPRVLRFVKKHEKSSILQKLCNFSSKLPCFGISIKFSAKSYKKCLISWKSTKNRQFGQNMVVGFATSICSFHLCRDWGNDFWNYVSRSTGVIG